MLSKLDSNNCMKEVEFFRYGNFKLFPSPRRRLILMTGVSLLTQVGLLSKRYVRYCKNATTPRRLIVIFEHFGQPMPDEIYSAVLN